MIRIMSTNYNSKDYAALYAIFCNGLEHTPNAADTVAYKELEMTLEHIQRKMFKEMNKERLKNAIEKEI